VELLLHPDHQGRGLVTEAAMAFDSFPLADDATAEGPRDVAGSGYGSRTR
jgi:hypothetical protein